MKAHGRISIIALPCFLAVIAFFVSEREKKTTEEGQTAQTLGTSQPLPPEQAGEAPNPVANNPTFTPLPDGRMLFDAAVAASQNLHQNTPKQDMEIVRKLLSNYRLIFRKNPIGSENQELTAQLLGKNPKKIVFIDPKHPALSPYGELLDRWSTPYLFHPLSHTAIEIRSNGPDQTPWTQDDLSLVIKEIEQNLLL